MTPPTKAIGRVHGNTITLEAPATLPEGALVLVILHPLNTETQAQSWRDSIACEQQGLDDEEYGLLLGRRKDSCVNE